MGKGNIVIDYFTPWCVYCENMVEEWNKLYKHYENNKNVLIAKVNCDNESVLCGQQGIR